MLESRKVTIYTDGGSRGNPGPSAAGFVLTDSSGKQLCAKGLYLGETTNNVAEYSGFVKSLECAKEAGANEVEVFSDSELLVRQINGQYKVKSELLKPLFQEAMNLLDSFESWTVEHITREKNTQADSLVNMSLDAGKDVEMQSRVREANKKTIRLGVLISGGGTTLLNILEHIKSGKLNAEIPIVISSRSKTNGVKRVESAGLKVSVIRKKDYADIDEFSRRIEEELSAANVDLVIQGGWLCLWKIPSRYENRVMNIHPALLPSFGGAGMWGHHVHEAVVSKGCKVSGCTVHFCTNEYDKGPIIIQRCCKVEDDDDADSLAARVFEQECIAYPEAIKFFADGKLKVKGNRVEIL